MPNYAGSGSASARGSRLSPQHRVGQPRARRLPVCLELGDARRADDDGAGLAQLPHLFVHRQGDGRVRLVEELELSVRSANCLQNADIKYIGELVQRGEGEMLKTKNFGRKSLNELKQILGDLNLQFGMKLENFPARKELDRMRGVEG